ncbi:ABC transporter family protein [Burkholderia pseudomallei MSHR2451]|nr:ABC transporter family protein [Burkholderia pseudomallei MSHR2451]
MAIVRVENVSKTYLLDSVKVTGLAGVSVDIEANRFTVLSGPSGSGKTTLLNMIGCIDRPDAGRVIVAGQDTAALCDDALSDFRAREVGHVFQSFNLLPVLSAYENVEYPLLMARTPARERARRVAYLLDAVGLAGKGAHRPSQLSGGQRQRVAIARARGGAVARARRRADREPRQRHGPRDHRADARDAARERRVVHRVVARSASAGGGRRRRANSRRAHRRAPPHRAGGARLMHTFMLALRNLQRNRRRSITTLLAMVVGVCAVLLFGGFSKDITFGLQTDFVRRSGHLQIQRHGYYQYGSGNPVAYGIGGYARLIAQLRDDPVLAPMIAVITPTLQFGGIAGNFEAGVSRTVLAQGAIADEQDRMQQWNDYGFPLTPKPYPLVGTAPDAAIVGNGVARVLHLCAPLRVPDCGDGDVARQAAPQAASGASGADAPADVLALAAAEAHAQESGRGERAGAAHIEVLAANAYGAPNVGGFTVAKAEQQGVKELDDVYLAMHLPRAQRLVYGGDAPRVTAIEIQLRHTAQLPAARARLDRLFGGRFEGQPLDVLDFAALNPFYDQTNRMFSMIFGFVFVLIGAIVLFVVSNTMSTAILERTVEIGTLRSMGVRRGGIQALFVCEGALLGVVGASIGVLVALALAFVVNHSGLAWTPPARIDSVALTVRVWGEWRLIALTFVGLAFVAGFSAWLPARHAARLSIVDALRYA